MDPIGNLVVVTQLADDLGWLEEHCRRQPDQARRPASCAWRRRWCATASARSSTASRRRRCTSPSSAAPAPARAPSPTCSAASLAAEANPQAGFTRHPIAYTSANGAAHLGRPPRLPRPAPAPGPARARPASTTTSTRSAACPTDPASCSLLQRLRRLGLPRHDHLGGDRLRAAAARGRRPGRRHRLRRLRRALQRRGADAVPAACSCRPASRSSSA